MKVVEKDNVVHGMLDDEYKRCGVIVNALNAKVKNCPKGALNIRRKKIKDKEYIYHYLVRRDGKKIVNMHVAEQYLPKLKIQIEEREKYRKEILAYKKRMVYLEKLLKKSEKEKGHAK